MCSLWETLLAISVTKFLFTTIQYATRISLMTNINYSAMWFIEFVCIIWLLIWFIRFGRENEMKMLLRTICLSWLPIKENIFGPKRISQIVYTVYEVTEIWLKKLWKCTLFCEWPIPFTLHVYASNCLGYPFA